MRLWSIHPKYLDTKGLVALWRESLLAKAVLEGKTKHYINHPQLLRFKQLENPLPAINTYLYFVLKEAERRSYKFDASKIGDYIVNDKIPIKKGQITYELNHLRKKLKTRDPKKLKQIEDITEIETHPLFFTVEGGVETWEKV